ncbi:hypothetical protein LguiA_022727 [Lonicera macranthoides]
MFLTMFISSHSQLGDLKQTALTYYLHDRPADPNRTAITITGIAGKKLNYTNFGTLFCTDDPMTETFDQHSREVGRGHVVFVNSASDGTPITLFISLVFTNMEYRDSTLQIQGVDRQFDSPRESAVVGGTGKFRFARGSCMDGVPSALNKLGMH